MILCNWPCLIKIDDMLGLWNKFELNCLLFSTCIVPQFWTFLIWMKLVILLIRLRPLLILVCIFRVNEWICIGLCFCVSYFGTLWYWTKILIHVLRLCWIGLSMYARVVDVELIDLCSKLWLVGLVLGWKCLLFAWLGLCKAWFEMLVGFVLSCEG